MNSFIVEWWSRIFRLPRFVSPHWWLRKTFPPIDRSYRFVDSWVLGHFLSSILLFLICPAPSLWWLEWIAVRYGGLLVIEAFFYEVNLLLFAGYRGAKKGSRQYVLSHRRLVVTSLQNYVAIIFWFAIFYRHWATGFTHILLTPDVPPLAPCRFLIWLQLSFHAMTSFGYSPVAPSETWTILLTLAQSAIGVFMALLILASFVRLLPRPGTKTRFEGRLDHPIYDPGSGCDDRKLRRRFWMSSISRESMALAAAIGAFMMSGISLFLGYNLLAAPTPWPGYLAGVNCLAGTCFVLFGMVGTILAALWLVYNSWPTK